LIRSWRQHESIKSRIEILFFFKNGYDNRLCQVIVCGGATKMPRLQKAIKEALPDSEILTSITADEVVALGCCNQAAIMGEPWDPSCDLRQVAIPVISKSISVKVNTNFFLIDA